MICAKNIYIYIIIIVVVLILQGLEKTLDGHKILLLEAAPDKTEDFTATYSNRVSNITPGSKILLESKLRVFKVVKGVVSC